MFCRIILTVSIRMVCISGLLLAHSDLDIKNGKLQNYPGLSFSLDAWMDMVEP
jgi:hypothetical protein